MTPLYDITDIQQRPFHNGPDVALLRDLFNRRDIATPTLIMSRSAIGRNYRALQEALPRAAIHYAIKPNNHQVIIDEVKNQGGSFDVCSAGEIDLVEKSGVDPATMIHSHPIKSLPEFDHAVGKGVRLFVVDNPEEVKKLARYTDTKLKIVVRFRININTTAVVNLQYKFGCTVDDVLPLANLIKESGHEFYGLCFHIGSQCIYSKNYVKAIRTAQRLINRLDMAGFDTRLLDIGGGFPVEYVEPVPPICEFCAPIARALDRHIRPGIKVISEPGRYIAATPTTLLAGVVGKALRDGKMWYYLDDGLYSTFSGMLYDHCQYPVITDRTGDHKLSVLAGPTCDSFDVIYDGLMLPNLEVGDRVAFAATGAYCAVSGSNFNALRRPEYIIAD
jgi:ornithine decarboxylase